MNIPKNYEEKTCMVKLEEIYKIKLYWKSNIFWMQIHSYIKGK